MSIRVKTNTRRFDGRTRRVQIVDLNPGDTFKFLNGNAVYVAGNLDGDNPWAPHFVDSYTNLQTGAVFSVLADRRVVKVKLADTSIL